MRYVLCTLGLFASSVTVAAGVGFLRFDATATWLLENVLRPDAFDASKAVSVTGISYGNVGFVLILAGVCGFVGVVQYLLRCERQGAILLLVPALGIVVVSPLALIFSSIQALVALLFFFLSPLPHPTSAPKSVVT